MREYPTLGWEAIDFIETELHHPDGSGNPYALYDEVKDFLLRWYAIDDTEPYEPRFLYRRGCLMRPRGWGKSPLLAAICVFEAVGNCEPVSVVDGVISARPRLTPHVTISAVSEVQANNTYRPLLRMIKGAPVEENFGINALDTFVQLPDGGVIEKITSSPSSVKGLPSTFAVLDQTEEWVSSNHGLSLFSVIQANAAKKNTRFIESPNAYVPLRDSVAERTKHYYDLLKERGTEGQMLFDYRPAPADTNIYDRESLLNGLQIAYGDAAKCNGGHVDLDMLIETIYDPAHSVSASRSDFLNQIASAENAYIRQDTWDRQLDREKVISPEQPIAIGFDGSIGRARGKADATALIGITCDENPTLFQLGVWEQPNGVEGWEPPREDIINTITNTFEKYNVRGFFADPHGWDETILKMGRKYAHRLWVRGSVKSPAVFPTSQTRKVARLFEEMYNAFDTGILTHSDDRVMGQHFLNAIRVSKQDGYLLYKPDQEHKIDCVYAGMLAFAARQEIISSRTTDQLGGKKRPRYVVW